MGVRDGKIDYAVIGVGINVKYQRVSGGDGRQGYIPLSGERQGI